MISIIDYGMGNLRSVQKAFENVGAEACVTQDPETIRNSLKVVLPGVGAMRPAMKRLQELNLIDPLKEVVEQNKPFLGICLGFQLLFEQSNEGGSVKGLGFLKGTVQKFNLIEEQSFKIPHMGWNQINIINEQCPLFTDIKDLANVYFCHSYYVSPSDPEIIATTTEYDIDFTSSVCKNNIFAVQFHPEKSQNIGLKIIKNFVNLN